MINDVLLLESLHDFFNVSYNRDKLLSVLSDDKTISLRSIDWFITNYSKKNNIYYLVYSDKYGNPSFDDENNDYRNNMNVFHSYKSQLKAYSKKRFYPFCRRDRILFKMKDDNSVKRVFSSSQEIISITVDPDLETADVDTSNNSWPKKETDKFDQFKNKIKE